MQNRDRKISWYIAWAVFFLLPVQGLVVELLLPGVVPPWLAWSLLLSPVGCSAVILASPCTKAVKAVLLFLTAEAFFAEILVLGLIALAADAP